MSKRSRVTTVVAILSCASSSLLVSCTPDGTSIVQPSTVQRSAAAAARPIQHLTTMDDLMEGIGQRASGFAGMYLDENQRLVVLRKAGSDAAAVSDVVRQYREQQAPGLPAAVRQQEVAHSFVELRQALRVLRPHAMSGAHFVDIDEVKNRVVVGVSSPADSVAGVARARMLGIDSDIVDIRVLKPVVLTTTIQEYIRPILGGIQIETYDGSTLKRCSAGAVARFSGSSNRYMLTASHCTPTIFGGDSSSVMYQSYAWYSWGVGVEAIDPAPFFDESPCEEDTYCRYSDVAAYRLDSASTPFSVAHTTSLSVTPGVKGSLVLSTPQFDITGVFPYSNLVVNQGLNHVGRTTGWSAGGINQTCTDLLEGSVWVLCNFRMRATFGAGDSGSPVFQWYGGDTGYSSYMAGIMWAAETFVEYDGDGLAIYKDGWFSPWVNITSDLGSLIPNP